MGFKCPVCLKDFSRDRIAWLGHIKEAHQGLGADAVTLVKKLTGEANEKR